MCKSTCTMVDMGGRLSSGIWRNGSIGYANSTWEARQDNCVVATAILAKCFDSTTDQSYRDTPLSKLDSTHLIRRDREDGYYQLC